VAGSRTSSGRSQPAISPEFVILCELLDRAPEFVSGNALAKKLGMSRVGVWMHMKKLREQGFEFEAVRSHGYRISRQPAGLTPLLIKAHLRPRHRWLDTFCLAEVDSTNDEAERELAAGRAVPFVVLSRRQTLGRGRFGRVWHSEDNGNLYASFAFRPRLDPARMSTFTLWMGASLCELVAGFCSIQPGIKWPNDLYFQGRKFGGMLTEARIDADEIRDLVFGLGLNVNGPLGTLPPELGTRATTLAECAAAPVDLNRLAAAVIDGVLAAYDRFVDGRHTEVFADLWNRYDLLRGKPVVLVHGNRHVRGTAAGIDDEGALLIRNEHGRPERFRAGEVTFSQ